MHLLVSFLTDRFPAVGKNRVIAPLERLAQPLLAGFENLPQGVIEFDPAHPESGRVEVTIDAASIDTRNEQRDNHLRSPDFLNVEQYPTITFVSKRIEPLGDNRFRVVGDLTLRGVTREVALDAEFLGVGKDPWGGERAGFTARTKLNRHDFGASWNVALEAGGFLVGDTLDVTLDIEAVRKADQAS